MDADPCHPLVTDLSVIYMGWIQAGCSDREDSVSSNICLVLPNYFMKIIFHSLQKCTLCALFVQTLCLYGEENANCQSGLFVAFHALYAGYFLFGLKL